MNTTEKIIHDMESSGIFMSRTYSFPEYTEQLLAFQKLICTMASEVPNTERYSQVEAEYQLKANEFAVSRDIRVKKGLEALSALDKTLKIILAGHYSEERVSKALAYIDRPNVSTYSNIYLSDGMTETELDHVLLTDAGILILETKNLNSNLTISSEGYLLQEGKTCHHHDPIDRKLERKKQMLELKLASELHHRGLDIPVSITTLLVFSNKKNEYWQITDDYQKQKWCFRGRLPFLVGSYTSTVTYSPDQMDALMDIMNHLSQNKRPFTTELDFNEIRYDIASMMAVFRDLAEQNTAESCGQEVSSCINPAAPAEPTALLIPYAQKRLHLAFAAACSAAVLGLGALAASRLLKTA